VISVKRDGEKSKFSVFLGGKFREFSLDDVLMGNYANQLVNPCAIFLFTFSTHSSAFRCFINFMIAIIDTAK
jgi:hypothetical protein